MSREKKIALLRAAGYGLLLVFLYVAETCLLPGGRAEHFRPHLLFAFTAAAAMWEEPFPAAVLGAFSGLLLDASSAMPDGLYLAMTTVAAAGLSIFAHRYLRRIYPVCVLLSWVLIAGEYFCVFLLYLSRAAGARAFQAFSGLLWALMLCAVFGIIPYGAVRRLSRAGQKEEQTE